MEYDLVITDKKNSTKLWLKKGGPFCLEFCNYDCNIDPSDVGRIIMQKPGLLRTGAILFKDKDDDAMEFVTDKGMKITAIIDVPRKEADNFYMAFSIFQDMGLDITAL